MQALRKVLAPLTLLVLLFGFRPAAFAKITITATPASLSFSAKLGKATPAPQHVATDGPDARFTISADQPWIVLPQQSNTDRGVRVSVNLSGLAAGTYSGHAFLSGPRIVNSPLSIPITLVISSPVIRIKAVVIAPAITGQPTGQTVQVSQAGTFSVAASGTAPLSYQWFKGGMAVGGAVSPTYSTPVTVGSDNGATFTVTVANSAGVATSNSAVLTVTPATAPPVITMQPLTQTVNVGHVGTFSVAASGTAPFSYQWTKNSAVISGATSTTYTTPATTSADNLSKFAVTVSNAAGTSTSTSATLNVAPNAYTINATPASLAFAFKIGGAAPAQQGITFGSSSPSPVPFTLSADQSWITLPTTSGNTGVAAQFGVATSSLAAGTYNGHVVITASGATNSPLSVPVTLVVSSAAVAPSLTINPSNLSFPSVTLAASSVQSISVTNSGTANINVSNVSVSGPGFTASGVSSGLILAPSQSATLNVTFAPAATGAASGGIVVTSNAANSPSSIALSGTGVAPVTHSVALSWSDASSGVSGYNIYRTTVSGGPYIQLNGSPNSSPSYDDTPVSSGQYYYVVTAVVNSVESSYSAEVSALVP